LSFLGQDSKLAYSLIKLLLLDFSVGDSEWNFEVLVGLDGPSVVSCLK